MVREVGLPLKTLYLVATRRCNGRCRWCNMWHPSHFKDLDLSLLALFLSSDRLSKVETVTISGGEPTLFPKLSSLLWFIADKIYSLKTIIINSNGSRPSVLIKIADLVIKELGLGLFINISLDGRPHIHDDLRGVPMYNLAYQSICDLLAMNVKVTISSTDVPQL